MSGDTSRARLQLTRAQILAFRRRVGAMDERLPWSAGSLRIAAWAGLQDSMPRAALLSIHARVAGTGPDALDHPSLAQVWGPRFSLFVVAERDAPLLTLGRYPDDARGRRVADDTAARLRDFLDGRRMTYDEAGLGLGVNPNALRYATTTGIVRLRWEGARAPQIWVVPPPEMTVEGARVGLAKRYLRVFGPTTSLSFAKWAGIGPAEAAWAFDALAAELTPVRTPIGEASILVEDEPNLRAAPVPPAPARLLPSGDSFWMFWGADRDLLVEDPAHRDELWTSRVWPGALLVGGDIVGTWRRADAIVSVTSWRPLTPAERQAVEAEAASMPLPGLGGRIAVRWER